MKKNIFKKSISILLMLASLLSLLCACKKKAEDTETTPQETTSSEVTTTPPVIENASIDLLKDGKSEFKILRPINVTEEQEELIFYFRDQFQKKTGVRLDIVYEKASDAPANDNFEILIGDNLRAETVTLTKGMRKKDYCYAVSGNKLIFAGGCEDTVKSAIQYFLRKFLDSALSKDKQNVTFTSADSYYEKINYYLSNFKIGGVDAYKYKIVYSENDFLAAKNFAYKLADVITTLYGYDMTVVNDSTKKSEHEIVVGNTNRSHPTFGNEELNIVYKDGSLYMHSSLSSGYAYLTAYVNVEYLRMSKELLIDSTKNITTPLSEVFSGGSENMLKRSGDVRILFNNVWSGNQSSAPAKYRAIQLAELYADYAPDIICLQEFSGVMNTDLTKYLKKMGYVEVPYATKNKNYAVRTPVFYNPKAVTLVDSGYWAFNDTANDKSKSIGWGVFKDSKGKMFCVASTHFYWTSDELGEYARQIDATELSEQMKKVSEKHNGIPIIIGGDYNCKLGSAPLEIMKKNGFTDVENTAIKTEMGGTHHSYPTINENTGVCTSYSKAGGTYETAIDHVFSYADSNLTVNLYDVIEDFFALASSDHCPLLTDITLK